MSYAKITLIGNVGKDPEIRTTQTGKKVASFSIATTEGPKNEQKTIWWRCEAWERTAEIIEMFVNKGSKIHVEGRPSEEEYTDRDGNQRKVLKVRVSDLTLLGSKSDSGEKQQYPNPAANVPAGAMMSAKDDDDLPF